ncbi:gag/pol protein [Cucumis melo var. makuwa]|uniref:Gag/pol protein n=1 Tax=Cucumis melo var. makuwa TaxID=1194695 RepID=A0A5D3CDT5_CUCMM|nr:gag/pol protein [Cucumis melo var. makuwa]
MQGRIMKEENLYISNQNSKKDLLPFRHGVHLSKEQCPRTPQEVEDMRCIPYASVKGSLMRTTDYMLVYGAKDLILTIYTNSDFQIDKDSRKSTSGSVFTLNGGVVVWRSIKQGCITNSTMKVEYVAACEAAKEAVCLKKFLYDLEVIPNMNLRNVNVTKIASEHNIVVQQGDVNVSKIASEHNIVDPFTKTLTLKFSKVI